MEMTVTMALLGSVLVILPVQVQREKGATETATGNRIWHGLSAIEPPAASLPHSAPGLSGFLVPHVLGSNHPSTSQVILLP